MYNRVYRKGITYVCVCLVVCVCMSVCLWVRECVCPCMSMYAYKRPLFLIFSFSLTHTKTFTRFIILSLFFIPHLLLNPYIPLPQAPTLSLLSPHTISLPLLTSALSFSPSLPLCLSPYFSSPPFLSRFQRSNKLQRRHSMFKESENVCARENRVETLRY